MNAYTFDIFIMHYIVMENTEENGIYTTTCELVEIGPLNGPDYNNLESIKTMICDISSTPVIQKWWADVSTKGNPAGKVSDNQTQAKQKFGRIKGKQPKVLI
jgi:hypothetical protein